MDIDIDMTNSIRNPHQNNGRRNVKWQKKEQARFKQKEKWFKENWNFEYKPKIDEENKANLQQHKDLESGSRKPNKIPRNFFKLRK